MKARFRVFSMLLALCMLITMAPIVSAAELGRVTHTIKAGQPVVLESEIVIVAQYEVSVNETHTSGGAGLNVNVIPDPDDSQFQIVVLEGQINEPGTYKYALTATYRDAFGQLMTKTQDVTVEVVKGYITTPEEQNWEENYYVVEYEKPISKDETVFTGMFAVSAYASDLERCMEIVTMLNTDGALRDIYAYGVEGENWELNEDGTVHMLNNDWSMDFYHSGNTFVGHAPESLPANYAEIGKLQNIETLTGPYMSWVYLNEETEALYNEYTAEAEKILAEFDAAADRVAYAESFTTMIKEDKEHIVARMAASDGDNNFAVSYVDFQTSMYGEG